MLLFVARSRVVLAAMAGWLILTSLSEAQSDRWKDRIKDLATAHKGKVAVAVSRPATGDSYKLNADEPMPTASLIKTSVMIEAYRQADAKKLDLTKLVTLTKEDQVPGSGILTTHFSPGLQISVRDAIRLMIAYSDNTATNLVIDAIGLPATAKAMEELGYPNTKIHAKVFKGTTSIFPERSKQFGLGSTTAADQVALLERLYKGELASEESTKAMLAHLRACEAKTTIPRLLPPGTRIGHKTGSVNKVRTDAGYLDIPGGPVFLCVLTDQNEDERWVDDNAGEVLIANIAKIVFDRFGPAPTTPGSKSPSEPLKNGANGALVEDLQRTLNERLSPSPALSVDGDFGPATETAVLAFQKSKKLPENGIVDAAMWKALAPVVTSTMMITDKSKLDMSLAAKEPADPLDGQPFVTCKAWAIGDAKTGEILAANNNEPLPMASTTKMMTAYIVFREAKKTPTLLDETIEFSERADRTPGSTADVRVGEKVTVRDLMYGLMLPSGNDAATAFAEHLGNRFAPPADNPDAKDPLVKFVAEMNRTAEGLGMAGAKFKDPHGLSSDGHHARARDMVILAKALIDDGQALPYISSRKYAGKLDGPSGYTRYELWKNTNRLLDTEGYLGMKTGTTNAAGACLVSVGEREGKKLIVVVLGSTSGDARYTDSRNLFRWAWTHQGGQKGPLGGQ